jgi:hypothetical protein
MQPPIPHPLDQIEYALIAAHGSSGIVRPSWYARFGQLTKYCQQQAA